MRRHPTARVFSQTGQPVTTEDLKKKNFNLVALRQASRSQEGISTEPEGEIRE